jgi:hypothetical protein
MLDLLLRRNELCQRVTHQVYAIFKRAMTSPRPAFEKTRLRAVHDPFLRRKVEQPSNIRLHRRKIPAHVM